MGSSDSSCCGDISHQEKPLPVATGWQVVLLCSVDSLSARFALKFAKPFILIHLFTGFGFLLHMGSLSSSRADPMLHRNELWGKNFLGLIVCLSSRIFSSV